MELTTADRMELHELMGRYGDAVDDRAWDVLGFIFTNDAVFEIPHLDVKLSGLDRIIEYMDTEGDHPQAHLMMNIHAEAEDDSTTGVRLYSRAIFPIPMREGGGSRMVFGSYYDDVMKTTDGWRVSHRVYSSDRIGKRLSTKESQGVTG